MDNKIKKCSYLIEDTIYYLEQDSIYYCNSLLIKELIHINNNFNKFCNDDLNTILDIYLHIFNTPNKKIINNNKNFRDNKSKSNIKKYNIIYDDEYINKDINIIKNVYFGNYIISKYSSICTPLYINTLKYCIKVIMNNNYKYYNNINKLHILIKLDSTVNFDLDYNLLFIDNNTIEPITPYISNDSINITLKSIYNIYNKLNSIYQIYNLDVKKLQKIDKIYKESKKNKYNKNNTNKNNTNKNNTNKNNTNKNNTNKNNTNKNNTYKKPQNTNNSTKNKNNNIIYNLDSNSDSDNDSDSNDINIDSKDDIDLINKTIQENIDDSIRNDTNLEINKNNLNNNLNDNEDIFMNQIIDNINEDNYINNSDDDDNSNNDNNNDDDGFQVISNKKNIKNENYIEDDSLFVIDSESDEDEDEYNN